jgi:hypothetical protein
MSEHDLSYFTNTSVYIFTIPLFTVIQSLDAALNDSFVNFPALSNEKFYVKKKRTPTYVILFVLLVLSLLCCK